jgi:hypothetical protein
VPRPDLFCRRRSGLAQIDQIIVANVKASALQGVCANSLRGWPTTLRRIVCGLIDDNIDGDKSRSGRNQTHAGRQLCFAKGK